MNERIKQLALRANIQYVVKISDDNKDIMCVECDNGFPTAKQFEKFAELIVRECDTVCQEHAKQRDEKMSGIMSDPTEQVVARKMGEKIKQHFGVEE